MTKIQAYFPEELYQQAVLDAKINNQNFSEFLRIAVENYLRTKPKTKKPKINVISLKNRKVENYSGKIKQIYDHKL
jgi:predicted DNA-binding ribbon-helix-helix protein